MLIGGQTGFYANYNMVCNCNFNNNGQNGVEIQLSHDNLLINCVIDGNTTHGIIIYDSGDRNQILNCKIINNGTDGIELQKSVDYNIISNCLIKGNQEHGIFINGGSFNNINNNILVDNSQKTDDTYSDIFLEYYDSGGETDASNYNIISGNNINATQANQSKYGIREDDNTNVDYNLIHGNIVQNAVTANISTQGANTISTDNIAT